MSYSVPWPRVYPGVSKLPQGEVKRLTIEMPINEADRIMSVAINPAIFSLICQSALHSTFNFIETRGLTYADSPTLIDFIRERADTGTPKASSPLDGTGGSEGVHPGATPVSDLPASAGSQAASGVGGAQSGVGRTKGSKGRRG
jgi:hypothetical protein